MRDEAGDDEAKAVNQALAAWSQGDVSLDAGLAFLHLAELRSPHSSVSMQAVEGLRAAGEDVPPGSTAVEDAAIPGVVVLSQTCDIVRDCVERPFVEVCPLAQIPAAEMDAVRGLRKPTSRSCPASPIRTSLRTSLA